MLIEIWVILMFTLTTLYARKNKKKVSVVLLLFLLITFVMSANMIKVLSKRCTF